MENSQAVFRIQRINWIRVFIVAILLGASLSTITVVVTVVAYYQKQTVSSSTSSSSPIIDFVLKQTTVSNVFGLLRSVIQASQSECLNECRNNSDCVGVLSQAGNCGLVGQNTIVSGGPGGQLFVKIINGVPQYDPGFN